MIKSIRFFQTTLLCFAILLMSWGAPIPVFGEVRFLPGQAPEFVQEPISLALETKMSTWKPRGRILYDLEASVRMKLTEAGFRVVRTPEEPAQVTLLVDYRETRGEPYGAVNFGTVLTGMFRLVDREGQVICELMVQESAHPSVSGTPPYLDSLEQFQTNPYYYFLGDILWQAVHGDLNPQVGLLAGLTALMEQAEEASSPDALRFASPDHSMVPAKDLLAAKAIIATIHEFIRIQNPAIVPFLIPLLDHSEANIKIAVIQGLTTFHVLDSLPELKRVKSTTTNERVKEAAEQALETLNGMVRQE